jgi:hypothetical protein
MRLFEFADAESQMELWKLITDSVWQAIYKQAQEQKQLDAQKAKSMSAAPKKANVIKPKIVSPQASKTKKTSAQKIQRQKDQSNTLKSKPVTKIDSSSSTVSDGGQNRSKAQPIKQTLAELDPFAQSAVVKKLTR